MSLNSVGFTVLVKFKDNFYKKKGFSFQPVIFAYSTTCKNQMWNELQQSYFRII